MKIYNIIATLMVNEIGNTKMIDFGKKSETPDHGLLSVVSDSAVVAEWVSRGEGG